MRVVQRVRSRPQGSTRQRGYLWPASCLMLSLGLILAACGADETSQESDEAAPVESEDAPATSGGVLRFGQSEPTITLDPMAGQVGNFSYFYQIFDPLILMDENQEPQPNLAESWELADDGLSLTLNLRKGVKFHDGSAFDAEDVQFTFDRLADPEIGATLQGLTQWVESIDATDSHTVVLNFEEPTPMIFDLLDVMKIMSSDADEESIPTNPIGTGPFMLDSAATGDFTRLTANPDWWGGSPLLDEIYISILPDPQSAAIALEIGEIDIYDSVPLQQIEDFDANPNFEVYRRSVGQVSHIFFNVTREPFDNKLVRQAIAHAIDRQAVVDTYFYGQSEPWCLPWPETSQAFDPELARGCPPDYERAAELMAEAGYPDGFEQEILSRPDSGDTVAEVLQQDLMECCNVKLNINSMTHAEAQPIWAQSDFSVMAHQHSRAGRHPSMALDGTVVFRAQNNRGLYDNPEWAEALRDVRLAATPEGEKAAMDHMNRMFLEESFSIPVAPIPRIWVAGNHVKNFRVNADGWPLLREVSLAD